MQVNSKQATSMITSFIKAQLVPMLSGSPGCGKSQIVKDIANNYNLKVIDLRLSQCDPTDLSGFPTIVGKKAGYVPMNTFPIEGDEIPEGFNGWMLFLDEFNSASQAVQAAAYKVVLDRMIGIYKLHKNVAIVCAGNLETDNAIVNPMSTALQSRLVHLELVNDHNIWIEWAESSGIDHRITSYVKFKPGNLYSFKPDHTDQTYACPRTWEFANRVLNVIETDNKDALPMLAGTVSEGIAREFLGFCKIHQGLPTIEKIASNPTGAIVPKEPSVLYALTGSIAHNVTPENFTALMQFIKRLPVEFQVVCLRETVRRNSFVISHAALQQWIKDSSTELF
jgi:hypothetical protein